jgi:hypothetical protein
MSGLAFVISIAALVLAYLAYRQSGGAAELKSKVDQLGITTDTLREKLADSLGRLEKAVRGAQQKSSTPGDQQEPPKQQD